MQIGFNLKYFNHPIEGFNTMWSPLKKIGVTPLDAILFLKNRAFFCVKQLLKSMIGNKFSRIEKEFLMFEKYQVKAPNQLLIELFKGKKQTNKFFTEIASLMPEIANIAGIPCVNVINKEFTYCKEDEFFFFLSDFSFDLKELAGLTGFDHKNRKEEFKEIINRSLKYMNTLGSIKTHEPSLMISFYANSKWYKCKILSNSVYCEKCGACFCPHLIVLVQRFGYDNCIKFLKLYSKNDLKMTNNMDRAKSKKLNEMKSIIRKRERKRKRETVTKPKSDVQPENNLIFLHPTTSCPLLITSENLERLTIKEMKEVCRKYKIKNFSKLRKTNLKNHLLNRLPQIISKKEIDREEKMDITEDENGKINTVEDEDDKMDTTEDENEKMDNKEDENENIDIDTVFLPIEEVKQIQKKRMIKNMFLLSRDSIKLNTLLLENPKGIKCTVCKEFIKDSKSAVRCDINECKKFCCTDCSISVRDEFFMRTTCKNCFNSLNCAICTESLSGLSENNVDFCTKCSMWSHISCIKRLGCNCTNKDLYFF